MPRREILHLRGLGYRWSEIGMWLEVPRGAVRAAMSADAWGRFMRREVRLGYDRCPERPQLRRHGPVERYDQWYDDDRARRRGHERDDDDRDERW
ncbi:hypothetical protein GF314_13785 [bacterium]|nr:hypothetical protein [bacterium]